MVGRSFTRGTTLCNRQASGGVTRIHRHRLEELLCDYFTPTRFQSPMFAMLVCNDNGSLELHHMLAWHVDTASNTQVSLWKYFGSNIFSLSPRFTLQASSPGFWEPKSPLQQAAIQLDMQNHSVTSASSLLLLMPYRSQPHDHHLRSLQMPPFLHIIHSHLLSHF